MVQISQALSRIPSSVERVKKKPKPHVSIHALSDLVNVQTIWTASPSQRAPLLLLRKSVLQCQALHRLHQDQRCYLLGLPIPSQPRFTVVRALKMQHQPAPHHALVVRHLSAPTARVVMGILHAPTRIVSFVGRRGRMHHQTALNHVIVMMTAIMMKLALVILLVTFKRRTSLLIHFTVGTHLKRHQ